MFALLLDGLAWLVVIGLLWLAFVFASAGVGAVIGKTIAAVKRRIGAP
jgi:hypothetical protein